MMILASAICLNKMFQNYSSWWLVGSLSGGDGLLDRSIQIFLLSFPILEKSPCSRLGKIPSKATNPFVFACPFGLVFAVPCHCLHSG